MPCVNVCRSIPCEGFCEPEPILTLSPERLSDSARNRRLSPPWPDWLCTLNILPDYVQPLNSVNYKKPTLGIPKLLILVSLIFS